MPKTRIRGNGERKNLFICCGATSCAVVAGYAISFSSVAMDDLRNEDKSLHLTKEQATWFGSLLPLMAIFGSLLSGPLMDYFGRRIALLSVTVCFLISWLILHQSNEISILFVGRGLSGVAAGMTTAIIPTYISEVSPCNLRGTMGAIFSVALALGLPVGYCCGMQFNWREVAEIGAVISCVSFIVTFVLPESHYWLIKQNNVADAIKTIKILRGSSYDYSQEFEDIQFLQKELNKGGSALNEFTSISFLKPVGIGMALMLFQQCSGINVIFFYAHDIFRLAGFDNEAVASVLASSMQVLAIFLTSLLVDNAGRRKLLLCSSIGMAICHAFIGVCMFYITNISQRNVTDGEFSVKDVNVSIPNKIFLHNFTLPIGDNVSGIQTYAKISSVDETTGQDIVVSWSCLILVMLYIAIYSIGMGPIPFIVLSEMVPFRARGVACGIGAMCNWLCAFILTKSFMTLVEIFEVFGVFWLFSIICFISAFFVWRFVPETSRKTLAEIHDLLMKGPKKKKSFTNKRTFSHILSRRPMSPRVFTKSSRSSSKEEEIREFIEIRQDP